MFMRLPSFERLHVSFLLETLRPLVGPFMGALVARWFAAKLLTSD
jgi:hypothetical protein